MSHITATCGRRETNNPPRVLFFLLSLHFDTIISKPNGKQRSQQIRVYRMDYPDYVFLDTLTASRRHFGQCLLNHQLHTVAEACGFDLRHHHHALADAEACAHIALQLL